jgi:hypothetical protein
MSVNTVRKYVQELEERQLIRTEPTKIVTHDGRKRNGSLLYTILPIKEAVAYFHQHQMHELDKTVERQRVAKKLTAQPNAQYTA